MRAFAHGGDSDGYVAIFRGWQQYRALCPNSYDPSPLRPGEIEMLLAGRHPAAA